MVHCWRIQVPSFGQPGRTDRHPEDASGILIIASRPDVGVGQFGAHHGVAPSEPVRSLGVDELGRDQTVRCFLFTKVSALAYARIKLCRRSGASPLKAVKKASLRM